MDARHYYNKQESMMWMKVQWKVEDLEEAKPELEVANLIRKWKSLPEYKATSKDSLDAKQFPNFHLEDKVKLWGESSVRHN